MRREGISRAVARLLAVLLLALVVLAALNWSWVVAQGRAVAVLAVVLELPVLEPMVRAVTSEPEVREVTIAGSPTSIVSKPGDDARPGVMFITGADARGRHQPEVQRLARGLARAGMVAIVPDLPGMREGAVSPNTIDSTVAAIDEAPEHASLTGDRIAVASASAGASLALIAAQREKVRDEVSAVAGVAPYADIRNILRMATTGYYEQPDGELVRRDAQPWVKEVLANSMLQTLADTGVDRRIVDLLEQRVEDAEDPLAPLRGIPQFLAPADARPALELLGNRDPERFDEIYERLPESLREPIESLSPLQEADRLTMPVEIATAPDDEYFPVGESQRLVEAAPNANLTITTTLEHASPQLSADQLRDLWRFNGFVVRFLHHAAAEEE